MLKYLFIVGNFFFHCGPLFAGGRDIVLADANGKILQLNEAQASSLRLQPKLANRCDDVDHACLEWQISGQNISSLSVQKRQEVMSQVSSAFTLWQGNHLEFRADDENLFYETSELPVPLSGPLEDEFGNPIYEGSFQINISPPEEILNELTANNELVQIRSYLRPDLNEKTAAIFWSGIYLNPQYLEAPIGTCTQNCLSMTGSGPLSFKAVLAFWIGKAFIGLSPSGNREAIMYPVQDPQIEKSFDSLSVDDRVWIEDIYDPSSVNALLKGKVINGINGENLEGAYITALDASILEDILNQDPASVKISDYIISGGLASKSGSFDLRVPPGNYVLIMEDLISGELRKDFFDDWSFLFLNPTAFESEFYDGKNRESNHESWESSLRAVLLAASIVAGPSQTVESIEFITNENSGGADIFAIGSSSEILSPYELPDNSDALNKLFQRDQDFLKRKGGSGGCQLYTGTSESDTFKNFGFLILACLILLRMIFSRNRMKMNSRVFLTNRVAK